MFMDVGSKLFGCLALWPVVGWGQPIIITPPGNTTVCKGESAVFISELSGGITDWYINGVSYGTRHSYPSWRPLIEQSSESIGGGIVREVLMVHYNVTFNGLEIQAAVGENGHIINSTAAYLFYETNQQFAITGLPPTITNTTAQFSWNGLVSNFTTQYLFGVYDHNNHLIVNQTTDANHASFNLPDSACHDLTFKITANQCPNPDSNVFVQNEATTFVYRKPDIDLSPVTVEFDNNKTVLVNWSPDEVNATRIIITDLDSGHDIEVTDEDDPPFNHIPPRCGQFNLNVSVSPAECPEEPGFTHRYIISFTIACPTTVTEPTETEFSGVPSRAQALIPSLLVVATVTTVVVLTLASAYFCLPYTY